MTTSIEDHAAMRLSGRLTVPLDCTCDEYATVIVEQAKKINRFENTYHGLSNCFDYMYDKDGLSESESKYRKKIIRLCGKIINGFAYELEELCQDQSSQ